MWQSSIFSFKDGRKTLGRLDVQVLNGVELPEGTADICRASVAATLPFAERLLPLRSAGIWEVSLRFGSAAEGRALNKSFRGKDYATNVLSFPSDEPPYVGDMFMVPDVIAREAADGGMAFFDHLAHLVVHGMLHLLGYDHEGPADTGVMEALEVEILASMGLENPYEQQVSDPLC